MTIAGSYLIFMCLISSCLLSWSFIIVNNCPHTIWPGTLAGAGTPQLPLTGFQLNSGQSVKLTPSPGWSGRIWARTGCAFDETGTGKCQTGDCGGKIECNGIGATPPASLFEITLGQGGGEDYYDVSIVDGYNLPLVATPLAVNGGCNATGCVRDLNLGMHTVLKSDKVPQRQIYSDRQIYFVFRLSKRAAGHGQCRRWWHYRM